MSLEPSVHFADIGAYIGVLNSLAGNKDDFENDIVAAVEQLDSDISRVGILPSFISNMTSARNAITSGEGNIVSAASDYHTVVLTQELPSTQATVSGVITDLFAAMNSYIPPQTFLSDGNFHAFYRDRFSRLDVPVAPVGLNTIDDSWGD